MDSAKVRRIVEQLVIAVRPLIARTEDGAGSITREEARAVDRCVIDLDALTFVSSPRTINNPTWEQLEECWADEEEADPSGEYEWQDVEPEDINDLK